MQEDIISTLLRNRNLETKEDIENFFNSDWEKHTHNPLHMKDVEKSVKRIKKALDNNEKIIIYSDYDCDGIPGGVVLHDFFKKIEKSRAEKDLKATEGRFSKTKEVSQVFDVDFENYIPHRHNEGYGIHMHAVEKFIKDNVKLIITVDLGITNMREIEYAQKNGIDVILTDHHLPIRDKNGKQTLPKAFAVINTKRDDCDYEEKMLCGCATAWKLTNAFLDKYREDYGISVGYEKWWLDMVGISTVADMVPLVGENRILAKYGLQVLRKSKRQGLQKILSQAKIKQENINEIDIGFGIAPRLNAAGRMSDPREAFLSLLDNDEANNYAIKLESYNNKRKKETNQANQNINFESFKNDEVVLIGDENWTPGILGLIASKVVEMTKKTVFVWGRGEDENVMKGSVRSGLDGANVVQLMSLCVDTLLHFGGHEQAGGFAVEKNNIENFRQKLFEVYKKEKINFKEKENLFLPEITIEAKNITNSFYKELQRFAPFGIGNINPVFEISGNILGIREFGENKNHIEVNLSGVSCIKFNVTEKEKSFYKNLEIDNLKTSEKTLNNNFKNIIGQIEWDNFKNKVKVKIV